MISKLFIQEIRTDDCKILRLADNSIYNSAIPVTNAILEVTPPGFDCPVLFDVEKDFNISLNTTNLNISSTLANLPDGVYSIKYSIKPNNTLFVEYDLMRNCVAMKSYIDEICKLFEQRCDISHITFHKKMEALRWIKDLLDASKYMVENRGRRREGLDLYNEALKMLLEYRKTTCYQH